MTTLSFDFVRNTSGNWQARWAAEKLRVAIRGTEEAPLPAHLVTLEDTVARWPEVQEQVERFTRGLDPGHHVPLDPPRLGGFAARTCRFDEKLWFEAIELLDDAHDRVAVCFSTGYPDNYASYMVVLEAGVPVEVSAYAS